MPWTTQRKRRSWRTRASYTELVSAIESGVGAPAARTRLDRRDDQHCHSRPIGERSRPQHLDTQLRRPGEPVPLTQKSRISRFQGQLCVRSRVGYRAPTSVGMITTFSFTCAWFPLKNQPHIVC
jgi:hypothetical protein